MLRHLVRVCHLLRDITMYLFWRSRSHPLNMLVKHVYLINHQFLINKKFFQTMKIPILISVEMR